MGRVVINRLGAQRPDDANIVRDFLDVWKDRRDFLARLTGLHELVLRGEAIQLGALELGDWLALGERLRHRLAVHRG